jgi:hypothetical protein
MTSRTALISILCVVSLAAVWAVLAQQHELGALRTEHQVQTAQSQAGASQGSAASTETIARTTTDSPAASSSELLHLRSEVTRLTHLREALVDVRTENERLRSQLAARGTNARSGPALPPGFIRKSEARFLGYRRPEDTLQSFLWALQNRDFTNLLQALTPESAQHLLQAQSARATEDFFKDAGAIPGLAILGQKTLEDGTVEMQIELTPSVPTETFHFRQINGEWKMAGPF